MGGGNNDITTDTTTIILVIVIVTTMIQTIKRSRNYPHYILMESMGSYFVPEEEKTSTNLKNTTIDISRLKKYYPVLILIKLHNFTSAHIQHTFHIATKKKSTRAKPVHYRLS